MSAITVSRSGKPALTADLEKALSDALAVVPPSWPLDRWIAVNPWWGLRHLPAERAVSIPGAKAKTSMLMSPAFYLEAWRSGRISEADVHTVMAGSEVRVDLAQLLAVLGSGESSAVIGAPSMLDQAVTHSNKPIDEVRQQVARACGLYFDSRQSRWLADMASGSLFESWLEQATHDLSLDRRAGLIGARSIIKGLSTEAMAASRWALATLNLAANDLEALAQRLLFELVGLSSWCRGVDWRAALEGERSGKAGYCDQLLTILLVWEAIAVQLASPEQRHQWQALWARYRRQCHVALANPYDGQLWIWHRAYEHGYQRQLIQTLTARAVESAESLSHDMGVECQAVFCIDVRSEVMRRHLESACPGTQTLGFAGFFGMPVTHQGLGPEDDVPRLPGLLAPAYRLADSTGDRGQDRSHRRELEQREMARQAVRNAKYSSLSSFTLVETTGLAWAWKLVRDSLNLNQSGRGSHDQAPGRLFHRHGGDPVTDAERVDLAEQLLRGMSLTEGFASLLVFVGHGSHTDNNPHQAGLACGACGGQNGGVNAGLAARLLNDPVVRAGLVKRGIRIPDFTLAIAAEHCTVTDQVRVMDRAQVPDGYLAKLLKLESGFADAARLSRRERAGALNLAGLEDDVLHQQMVKRTVNWAEPRPEWGLANNAAIIFAQRSRTKGLNLQGRAFLHDYDAARDPDGEVLAKLMTAPMVVASWINLQYLGSVAAPDTFGAGNKLLHSVVGGNLGVIEGNDPDLRIGLALQSVHDGQRWRHEPVRLNVVIDAPRASIERVMAAQADVANLVENQWLWLFRYTNDGIERYADGGWQASWDSPS